MAIGLYLEGRVWFRRVSAGCVLGYAARDRWFVERGADTEVRVIDLLGCRGGAGHHVFFPGSPGGLTPKDMIGRIDAFLESEGAR
jgi:hypothetical protein